MNSNEQTGAHAEQDHAAEHHVSLTTYWLVFAALCVLTLCSFLTYFPWWDNMVPTDASRAFMLAVSCGKALLVMMFFMHLLWEATWKWVLTVPAAMMSVFLIAMLVPDIGFRTEHYSQDRWLHAPTPSVEVESSEDAPAPH